MLNPKVWGPHAWFFLHSVTLGYPDEPTADQRREYKRFFTLLSAVLPCDSCRNHFKQNLSNHPLTNDALSSRHNLVKWLLEFHNMVNEATGARKQPINEMLKRYTDAYKTEDSSGLAPPINQTPSGLSSYRYLIVGGLILFIMVLVWGHFRDQD